MLYKVVYVDRRGHKRAHLGADRCVGDNGKPLISQLTGGESAVILMGQSNSV